MDDTTKTPAPWHGKIRAALSEAERAVFTRPAPKSAQAQMKFLRTREKGSTRTRAERLGVSLKAVERYLSGASKKPQKRLQACSGAGDRGGVAAAVQSAGEAVCGHLRGIGHIVPGLL